MAAVRHTEPQTPADFFLSIHSKIHEKAFRQSLLYDYNFEKDFPEEYKGRFEWEKDVCSGRPSLLSFPRTSVSTMVTLTQEVENPAELLEIPLPSDFALVEMDVAGEGTTQPLQSLDDGFRTRRRALTDPE